MSNKYEGQKCPICQSYLFEEDDIVVCPVCGAPQHRDCYNTLGHCGLAQNHGTPQQYDLAKAQAAAQPESKSQATPTQTCPRCRREVSEDAIFCAYCGTPLTREAPHPPFGASPFAYTGYDPYGGANKKTDIDGITVEQAKDFVISNTPRYIQKFIRLNSKNRISWNWAAFLLPYGWFFSRKQYKWGVLTALAMLAATVCLMPLQAAITSATAAMPADTYILEAIAKIVENGDISAFAYGMMLLGNILSLGTRILSGLFGDYAYRNHVIATVKKIEADDEADKAAAYLKKGGVNPLFLLGSYLVLDWLTALILSLL